VSASDVLYNPLFGVTLTLVAYVVSLAVHGRRRHVHPLFLSSALLVALLALSGIPYDAYKVGGDLIAFFLGPATIALGVPLYKNAKNIRRHLPAIVSGVTAGSVVSIAGAGAMAWAMGGTREIVLSMLPKSVTSPVAIEISRQLGGLPELSATVTVLAGLLGSMIGPEFLRLCGIRGGIPLGTAIGTAAHGIGTARLIRESEPLGGVSGFAMGLAAIVTSVLMIPLYALLPVLLR
jgi:predicted murein hydrolase (TIGR00659 family)